MTLTKPIDLPTRRKRLRRLGSLAFVLLAYVAVTAFLANRYTSVADYRPPRAEIRGQWFYKDGSKFLVKAVGWDPARPGELPWERRRSRALVEADFARIRAAGFNTVRSWDALTPVELATAERQGLSVLQGIWLDPDGDFSDRAFRRDQIAKAARVARESRRSRAVLAYLVMNEPSPEHVVEQGVGRTRAFLREIAVRIREEDPGALVSFSSWPGLEFLDEPEFDFVAVNLYPFRPSVLVETVGYGGMVSLWRKLQAGTRPLLVTEYGISVSPGEPLPDGPGGATEAEQAEALPRLAEAILRNGAAGAAAFMWNDGWWKNHDEPGDENSHDPLDGEEWFGLNAMDSITDTHGRPRPALQAVAAWNRAVLTLPRDGLQSAREVPVEVHVEGEWDGRVEVELNGGEPMLVPTVRDGEWVRGRIGLAMYAKGAQRLRFRILDKEYAVLKVVERVVVPPGEAPTVSLEVAATGSPRRVVVLARNAAGEALAEVAVRLAAVEPTRRFDRKFRLLTDAGGKAEIEVELPPHPGRLLLVAAVEGAAEDPPLAMDAVVIESTPGEGDDR